MSDSMTISQALRRIKKLKGEIGEHSSRAHASTTWVSDKPPVYNFQEEFNAMQACQCEMLELESRVAVANANNTIISNGKSMTLAAVIRNLQELKGRIAFYKGLVLRNEVEKKREQEWDDVAGRMVIRTSEIIHVSAMTELDRNAMCKQLQDQFEEMNNKLESANHTTLI